jgi:hypothetical protein
VAGLPLGPGERFRKGQDTISVSNISLSLKLWGSMTQETGYFRGLYAPTLPGEQRQKRAGEVPRGSPPLL